LQEELCACAQTWATRVESEGVVFRDSLRPDMATAGKFAPLTGYARADINRAGEELRRWWRSNEPIGPATGDAIAAMIAFRETFQVPLKKTAMGLRSTVQSECPELNGRAALASLRLRLW